MQLSAGFTGDAYDKAMAESSFASLETDLVDRTSFRTRADARLALFDSIGAFCSRERRNSALGYLSPAEFEEVPSARADRLARHTADLHEAGP